MNGPPNGDGKGGNRTVFRPSPLQGLKQGGGAAAPAPPPAAAPSYEWGAPSQPAAPPPAYNPPPPQAYEPPAPDAFAPPPTMSRGHEPGPALAPSRLREDDVPQPSGSRTVRNLMLTEAAPVLALAASIRSGRVRLAMPQFHKRATDAIAAVDQSIAQSYSPETRQRARYALCATIDDIAQTLPGSGNDGAEWARRSLVVSFFKENIGGDRFWQLVDDMIRYPADNRDLIELFHACLAAGFEGRFRVMPDGQRRLHEIMAKLQGALEHVRSVSPVEMAPQWKGEQAPLGRVGFWAFVGMAAAAAAGLLFLIYVVLRLLLMSSGEAPSEAVAGLNPDDRLRLSRAGGDLPQAESQQAGRLKTFLKPEIDQGLVTVEEDGQTVRVRTTVGQLFQSASDELEPGRRELFDRIARAVEVEPGPVTVEGHADADKVASLAFPDNQALSAARADRVAEILRAIVGDPSRISAEGFGDATPIASNDSAEGKSQNRRVEIVLQRQFGEQGQ